MIALSPLCPKTHGKTNVLQNIETTKYVPCSPSRVNNNKYAT